MSPASGGRRPRVLVAAGPVGELSPRATSVALARGFAPGAEVAVAGLAQGGIALGRALSEPDGELEVLSTGWVASAADLLAIGCEAEPAEADPLAVSSAGLGRLVAYAVQRCVPRRVLIDLSTSNSSDAGEGMLAELANVRPDLQQAQLIGVIPPGQQQDRLLGLRGITSRLGRSRSIPAQRMLAVDAAIEHFADSVAPDLAQAPGAGAAGGLGFAVLALGGRLATGAALCADEVDLDGPLRVADLVVTACDSFDFGSRGGGVVAELADRCERFEVPLVVVSPVLGMSVREMRVLGVESAYSVEGGAPTADALTATARRIAQGWTSHW